MSARATDAPAPDASRAARTGTAARSDARRLERARELHRRAVAENWAVRPAAARTLLGRALALITGASDVPTVPDVPAAVELSRIADAGSLVVRVVITMAKSEAELHGLQPALRVLANAEALARRTGEDTVRVSIANQRGLLYQRFGRPERAIAEFDAAEPYLATAPPLDAAHVLLNRGVARMDRGELALARRDLERSATIAGGAELVTVEAMAQHNLGYLEFLAGNLPRGLDLMRLAARPGTGVPMGISYLDQARVLAEAGLTRDADAALARAVDLLRRGRSAQDVAEAELARAECALLAGDVGAARRDAARARDRFRRRGNDTWRRRAELTLLRGDLGAGRPGTRLVAPALRLREEFTRGGQAASARSATLLAAEALLQGGRTDAAAELVAQLPAPGAHDPITARLHARHVAASVARAGGDRAAARALTRRGLAELGRYRALFGSIDVRTASAVHGRRLAALDVALALESGRAAAVFDSVERVRAIGTRLAPVRPPDDPVAAGLLAELRRTVTTSALDGGAASLHRRRRELEREITARRWTLPGEGRPRPAAGLAEVRGALAADGTDMVVYLVVGDDLHALVLDAGRPRVRRVGSTSWAAEQVRRVRADLDALATPLLPAGLRVAVEASLRRSLAAIDETVVRPLGPTGRIVLVTTGTLGQLPWGLLPSLRGVPVVVAPSATAWATARRPAPTPASGGVVVLAGPGLDRAPDEARAVAALHDGARALVGADATRAAFAEALAGSALVHVAAHGTHQTQSPLFSAVRMDDGPLFAHELDATARTAGHVVLSACELGLATVRPGDEALGLTSVLLHLGTRCVVAGVARVGDEAAAAAMRTYHRRLAAGDDAAAALAHAVATAPVPLPFGCFGSTWHGPGGPGGG